MSDPASTPLVLFGLMLLLLGATSHAAGRLRLPSVAVYLLLGLGLKLTLGEQLSALPAAGLLHFGADVGLVLLFLALGLQFPAARVLHIARQVWPAGLMDVLLNLAAPAALAWGLGTPPAQALLLGALSYATSSSITLRLMEENRRLAHPESEFQLALLVFEDLLAPLVLTAAALALGSTAGTASLGGAPEAMATASGLFRVPGLPALATALALTAVLLVLIQVARRSGSWVDLHLEEETVPMLVVGVALAVAGAVGAGGLSEALGAFLVGMALAESGRGEPLHARVAPLRDLTVPLFFLVFGLGLSPAVGAQETGLWGILLAWSVMGKVATGYVGGRWFGLASRPAWRAGFGLVARGEFSVVAAALAGGQLAAPAGLYVLVTAILGGFSYQLAPRLVPRRTAPATRRDGAPGPP